MKLIFNSLGFHEKLLADSYTTLVSILGNLLPNQQSLGLGISLSHQNYRKNFSLGILKYFKSNGLVVCSFPDHAYDFKQLYDSLLFYIVPQTDKQEVSAHILLSSTIYNTNRISNKGLFPLYIMDVSISRCILNHYFQDDTNKP